MPEKTPSAQQKTAQGVPKADAIKLKGTLKKDFKDIVGVLRTVSFLEVAQEKDSVSAAYVESRDINKMPYLFSILKITTDEVSLVYSIPPEIAPKKRRLDMVRYMLNILSLLESVFSVDQKTIYQMIEVATKEMGEGLTMEQSKLLVAYDTLKKEHDVVGRRLERLNDENEALRRKNFELKEKNDELMLRTQDLETLSDATLKMRLQEWISDHNGEINIYEFCKVYKVSETRAEETLNRLMGEGYIQLVG